MSRKIDWESQIGRRLKLRDLHVFVTVVQHGSMAKAAQHLGVAQPSVSEVIADLEHTLGVRLLDRRPQGVEPTMYGGTLVRRSIAVFDELKQTVRDIEFMSNPTSGEVRIGCQESIAAAILSSVIHRFSQNYPRVVLHVEQLGSLTLQTSALRERRLDVAIFRYVKPLADEYFADDLKVEILFHDQLVVATGTQNRWARRRKINLAELVDEPWILSESDTWNYLRVAEAFQVRGLDVPNITLVTLYHPSSSQFGCHRPVYYDVYEIDFRSLRQSIFTKGVADPPAFVTVARCARDPKKSHPQPRCRALHRACPQLHEIGGWSTNLRRVQQSQLSYPPRHCLMVIGEEDGTAVPVEQNDRHGGFCEGFQTPAVVRVEMFATAGI